MADDLETIGGNLSVKSAHALALLSFPKLSDVGLLDLDTIPSLELLNVSDGITSMGENRITDCGLLSLEGLNPKSIGSLEVSENTDLNEITFNDLKSASGPLSFSSNAKNLSLGLFNLANGSNISVSDAENIDLRSLRYLTGALTLDRNTINSFNMPNLTQVGGNLAILNNPHLDFLKFWALQTINGDLSIENNTDLDSAEFKELFSIKGDITFSSISK